MDAVVVAAFALLEAEVAILEALKARKTAIEVAGEGNGEPGPCRTGGSDRCQHRHWTHGWRLAII